MPKQKPDKYWNEKQLLADLIRGGNDIAGRGFFAPMLGSLGDLAGLGENGIRALVGKPQVEPWGGSEHIGRKMQKAGLVSPERRPKTELLASLVSPGAVLKTALNAPKTAVNALKAISRLDDMSLPMPRAKQGQLGAIDVWHGSPHKFDTFKAMDNIGGGEGAQAYGHGGYHASAPEVALSYTPRDANFEKKVMRLYDQAERAGDYDSLAVYENYLLHKRPSEVLDSINDTSSGLSGAEKARMLKAHKTGEALWKNQKGSNLYRNQLRWPDPAREAADPLSDKHFLDWDKPLSEQGASVRQALGFSNRSEADIHAEAEALFEEGNKRAGRAGGWHDYPELKARYDSLNDELSRIAPNITGEHFYRGTTPDNYLHSLLGGNEIFPQSSAELAKKGIPGIRYLDGGSRSAGQGSHNYVTFDDALVNILERNGQPVGNLSKLVAPQDEALRVAQANAVKPVEQGGLAGVVKGGDNAPMKRDFRKELADKFRAETGDDISVAGTKLAGLQVRRDMLSAGNSPKGSLDDIYTPEQVKMLSDWEDYGTRSSNYAYHGTDASSLDGIRQNGLVTNPPTRRQDLSKADKIYLSANQRTAKRYADGYSGKGAVLRVKSSGLKGLLEPDHFEDAAYMYGENIPPELLEMKVGKKWVPVSNGQPVGNLSKLVAPQDVVKLAPKSIVASPSGSASASYNVRAQEPYGYADFNNKSPVKVMTLNDGSQYLLDGYHRRQMAINSGAESIDANVIPISDYADDSAYNNLAELMRFDGVSDDLIPRRNAVGL